MKVVAASCSVSLTAISLARAAGRFCWCTLMVLVALSPMLVWVRTWLSAGFGTAPRGSASNLHTSQKKHSALHQD